MFYTAAIQAEFKGGLYGSLSQTACHTLLKFPWSHFLDHSYIIV